MGSYFGSKATSGLCQPIIALMPPHDTYIETHLGGGAIMKRKPPALHNIGIDLNPRALAAFECDYPVKKVNDCAHRFLAEYDYGGRELIYSDPPYLHHTRTSGRRYRFDYQACLRPRDRFWDIPVPKIDSAFDNLFVPQPSWSPSTTQQLRKLVAAPYLAPNDWTPRSEAYFVFPLAQGTPGKQCGLAATGVYQPSLRSPWLAAEEQDHIELLELLKTLPCNVILSGYPSALYDERLAGWRTLELQVMNHAGVRTEKLWFNFTPDRVHWASCAGRNFTDRQRIRRRAANWGKNYRALPREERLAVLAAMMAVEAEDAAGSG